MWMAGDRVQYRDRISLISRSSQIIQDIAEMATVKKSLTGAGACIKFLALLYWIVQSCPPSRRDNSQKSLYSSPICIGILVSCLHHNRNHSREWIGVCSLLENVPIENEIFRHISLAPLKFSAEVHNSIRFLSMRGRRPQGP